MNQIAIDLGFVKIYWYSITMFLGMLAGVLLFYKRSKSIKIKDTVLSDMLFYMLIFGIIGARIYYVIFNLGYYLKYPIEIFEIWNGGLAIHGAILGGLLTVCYFCKKYNLDLLKITDISVPCLIIGQAIGRWGNFFNSEAHGGIVARSTLEKLLVPNFVINGMYIDGVYFHPTFYYEFIWNTLGFILLIILSKKASLRKGQLTGVYLVWYSFARFFIEGLRTDSLMLGSLRIAQVISILLFILGLILIFYKGKMSRVNMNKERIEKYED